MTTKFDQLAERYDSLSVSQKKQFIENYRRQLQTERTPESLRFLNECVRKYNDEVRAHFKTPPAPQKQPPTRNVTKPEPIRQTVAPTPAVATSKSAKLKIMLVLESLVILAGIIAGIVIFFMMSPLRLRRYEQPLVRAY